MPPSWKNLKAAFAPDSPITKLLAGAAKTAVAKGAAQQGIGVSFMKNSADIGAAASAKLNNGVSVPLLGFGTWQMEGKDVYNAVKAALKAGYRHIDTAQGYGNEADVGRAIKDSGVPRKDIFLATKLSEDQDFGIKATRDQALNQMKELGVDYLDLYMIHGPTEDRAKMKEAWQAMEALYKEGKIKALGVSNYEVTDLEELKGYAKVQPATVQNKYDPYNPGSHETSAVGHESVLAYCKKNNLRFVAYSILNSWPFELSARQDPHVLEIAAATGKTPSQVLLRWALQMGMAVIPKSKTPARIVENSKLFDFTLDDAHMRSINGLSWMTQAHPPGFVHNSHDVAVSKPTERPVEEPQVDDL